MKEYLSPAYISHSQLYKSGFGDKWYFSLGIVIEDTWHHIISSTQEMSTDMISHSDPFGQKVIIGYSLQFIPL